MGNYRDRLDIIADILNVVSREAKKTQIMYQANLSYKVLQRYLNEIVQAALVRFETGSQSYMLTFKGKVIFGGLQTVRESQQNNGETFK